MTKDRYEDFAPRYDLFFKEFGRHDDREIEFFRKIFTQNGVRSVLDCACGTGHDLVLFHSLGCEVVGSDISVSMLLQAGRNLKKLGIKVRLQQADYRELSGYFDRRFDAVVCLSSSLLEMPDDEEALRALRSMREILRDGGILILSQGTTDKQWRKKPRFILAVSRRDFSRIFVIDYLEKGARYNILDLAHGGQNKEFRVWSIEYTNMLLKDDQEQLLKSSGFNAREYYGTYSFEPYDKETSDLLIAVAHK